MSAADEDAIDRDLQDAVILIANSAYERAMFTATKDAWLAVFHEPRDTRPGCRADIGVVLNVMLEKDASMGNVVQFDSGQILQAVLDEPEQWPEIVKGLRLLADAIEAGMTGPPP